MPKKDKPRAISPTPWRIIELDHGTRVVDANGETVAWCGADWSSAHGEVPHRSNALAIIEAIAVALK